MLKIDQNKQIYNCFLMKDFPDKKQTKKRKRINMGLMAWKLLWGVLDTQETLGASLYYRYFAKSFVHLISQVIEQMYYFQICLFIYPFPIMMLYYGRASRWCQGYRKTKMNISYAFTAPKRWIVIKKNKNFHLLEEINMFFFQSLLAFYYHTIHM